MQVTQQNLLMLNFSVKVVNGNFLVEAWGDIATGDIMNIPGAHKANRWKNKK